MKKIFFLLGLFLSAQCGAQIITTVAGGGAVLGDGGLATAAQITLPSFCEFDGSGNLYFFQNLINPRIRKILPSGIITTVAGNGAGGFAGDGGMATAAKIKPQGITVDAIGNIYIADYYNNRVRKVDAITGIIQTIAGNGTPTSTGDGGLAIASTIVALDVCVDGFGNIFVSDNNGFIRKIDVSTGIISHVASTSALGMCFDKNGNLLLGGGTRIFKVDTLMGNIDTIAGTGLVAFNGDGIPATSANLKVMDLTIDDTGNLYFADMVNDRVRRIDTFGIITTIAGTGIESYTGDGGAAIAATLYNPEGVAIDQCGNLYIADDNNNRIRKVTFNPSGIAVVSIAVSPNDTVCAGTPVTFTATTTGSSTSGYIWYRNGVAIAGATGNTYTYTPAGAEDSIRCVYTGVDICGISAMPASNTIHMTVVPLSAPAISLSAPASATVGSVVFVNATVSGAGSSYNIKWYRNGVQFYTSATPVATYTKAPGTDVLTATISSTDANGCYDTTAAAPISVVAGTGGVGQVAGYIAPPVVYPNPAGHHITAATQAGIGSVLITDLPGRKYPVPTIKTGANEAEIDIEKLPAGMYLLHLTDGAGNKSITKFCKE